MDEQPATDHVELEMDLPPGQEAPEDAPQKRTVRRTALSQGSSVPLGWKPTVREPVPVVRCRHTHREGHPKAGEQCEQWSLRGSQLCYAHSGRGNLRNVEEYRQAIIESARLKLLDGADDAVKVLFDLMANSGADNVRLKAATEVLDRNGLGGTQLVDLNVTVDGALPPAATLAERLTKLKEAADHLARMEKEQRDQDAHLALEAGSPTPPPLDTDSSDVIDAEVVEESTDTLSSTDTGTPNDQSDHG